jgi:hypothetical protein
MARGCILGTRQARCPAGGMTRLAWDIMRYNAADSADVRRARGGATAGRKLSRSLDSAT